MRIAKWFSLLALVSLILAACVAPAAPSAEAPAEAPAAETSATEEPAAESAAEAPAVPGGRDGAQLYDEALASIGRPRVRPHPTSPG